MRLWSLHPKYLDTRGLVALWREALLAQAVLRGRTDGYRHHPQLLRFRSRCDPVAAIGAYLRTVHAEATTRGYQFDRRRINKPGECSRIMITRGQIAFEFQHLLDKLKRRDPARYRELRLLKRPAPNPAFIIGPGDVESWEKH